MNRQILGIWFLLLGPHRTQRWLSPAGMSNPGQRPRWTDGFALRLPGRRLLVVHRAHPCERRFFGQRHHFHQDGFCNYCGSASEERLLIDAALGKRWAERVLVRRSETNR